MVITSLLRNKPLFQYNFITRQYGDEYKEKPKHIAIESYYLVLQNIHMFHFYFGSCFSNLCGTFKNITPSGFDPLI